MAPMGREGSWAGDGGDSTVGRGGSGGDFRREVGEVDDLLEGMGVDLPDGGLLEVRVDDRSETAPLE